MLDLRFNSLEYLRLRVKDPFNRRGGLNLGPALILNQNPIFEMASSTYGHILNRSLPVKLGIHPKAPCAIPCIGMIIRRTADTLGANSRIYGFCEIGILHKSSGLTGIIFKPFAFSC